MKIVPFYLKQNLMSAYDITGFLRTAYPLIPSLPNTTYQSGKGVTLKNVQEKVIEFGGWYSYFYVYGHL